MSAKRFFAWVSSSPSRASRIRSYHLGSPNVGAEANCEGFEKALGANSSVIGGPSLLVGRPPAGGGGLDKGVDGCDEGEPGCCG
jgi:hypothetical protein